MSSPDPTLETALSSSYRIERELGRGGMAVVYLAHDLKHDRKVALKVIRSDLTFPGAAERFAREIRLAARLQHPHILSVHDSGESAGQLWFTMPFVEGESLRDRLQREGRLPIADALRIAREAAQALAYAHQHSVIHRDVKPENLLLTRDGSVLVADFGIARAIAQSTLAQDSAQLTETGISVGTPAYMAPDVRLGASADARSDVYSLAAVLYEMLTGKLLAPGGAFGVDLLVPDTMPLVRAVRAEVPEGVDLLVRRGLHPDPEQRYGSMVELTQALAGADTQLVKRRKGKKGGLVGTMVIVGLLVIAAGWALARRKGPLAATHGYASVAVLPFQTIGGDTTQAYFAQGMGDELTTALVQNSNVRVASQSGLARIQPDQMTPQEIGHRLGVNAVLEGTVRRSGNQLRVTAQLTNTADGVVLWADRYDRELRDVFQVQDEITNAIVSAIQGALTAAPSLGRGTSDLMAYDLYLRGRYYWSKRGREALTRSIDYLHQAVRRDSTFARAYAGLAMDYVLLPVFTDAPSDSAMALAQVNAARALALDSSLAEAHLALAYTLKNGWRFPESEREFRAALALAPNDAGTHHWYGVLLYTVGRIRESMDQMAQARSLDQFSSAIAIDGAVALLGARHFADARAEVLRAIELDSTRSDANLTLGWIHLAQGHPDSAILALERARRFGTGFDIRAYLSIAYRKVGRIREADQLAGTIQREFRSGQSDGFSLALVASAAGDRPTAIEALVRTFDRRPLLLTEFSVPCEPVLDSVRSDPRFIELLKHAGMMECDAGT